MLVEKNGLGTLGLTGNCYFLNKTNRAYANGAIWEITMKDARDMLRRIIVQEVQYIEAMSLSLKQDEQTILRLQNKANCLQKEIEERKELIEEYRSYLKHGSDQPSAKIRLIPSAGQHLDTESSAS